MVIPVINPETADLEKSYLADPIAAGVTSLTVKNNNRFAANDRIMIGEMGQEKTEVVTVSAVSGGTVVTVGTTVFEHEADAPVYKLLFDQVKFYRATSLSGSYSVISTQNLDVDNATLTTSYDDTSGTTSHYYKFTFYHSVSAVESAFSDPISGGGYRRNQVGNIIDEILQEVGDVNESHVTRREVLGYFNDVNDDLTINVSKPYDFLRTRTTLTRTANAITVDFPTDSNGDETMWKFDRMDYNYMDSTTDPDTDHMSTITVLPEEEFRNRYSDIEITSTNVSDAKPEAISLDTAVNKFRVWPASETTIANAFYLYYWKYFTRIDSEGDLIETPTPKIYKLYSKGMFYRKRAVTEPSYLQTADRLFADYQVEKAKYTGVDRKDRGTPRSFRPETRTIKSFRR